MPSDQNPNNPAFASAGRANTPQAQKLWAVVPAAGVGSRMHSDTPKQFLTIAGKPILVHSVAALLNCGLIDSVLVVVAPNDSQSESLLQLAFNDKRLQIVHAGGQTRAQTVSNGLTILAQRLRASANDWVMVHDAARPGLSQTALHRLISSVKQNQLGGILALPVTDTLKRSQVVDGQQWIDKTIPRESLWLAQTPQMFRFNCLLKALTEHSHVTDEASAIEATGQRVQLIEGERRNLKITVPEDLLQLEALLKGEPGWNFA